MSKSLRARIMIKDILIYAWDNHHLFNDDGPANLVICLQHHLTRSRDDQCSSSFETENNLKHVVDT
ncbi:unnamed protein product [Brassica oleracea var. botrytis]|uniref:(rape) hypothetical protein n=1 Tax=Brassica napus TaxID=3708 RepID=A0A816K919_BRANA|nr:unnamed protein product [Brassica napus]